MATQSPAKARRGAGVKWINLGKTMGKICPESGRWEGATPMIAPRPPELGPQGSWGAEWGGHLPLVL